MKKSLLLLLLAVAVAAPMQARGRKTTSTEPGKYKEWGPDIDQIEIVKPFKLADYKAISVEPFETAKAKLPDRDDNSYEAASKVLASSTEGVVQGLRGSIDQKVSIDEKERHEAGTLILKATVTVMDPGARARIHHRHGRFQDQRAGLVPLLLIDRHLLIDRAAQPLHHTLGGAGQHLRGRLVGVVVAVRQLRLRRLERLDGDRLVVGQLERLHDLDLVDVRAPLLVLPRLGRRRLPAAGLHRRGHGHCEQQQQQRLLHDFLLYCVGTATS